MPVARRRRGGISVTSLFICVSRHSARFFSVAVSNIWRHQKRRAYNTTTLTRKGKGTGIMRARGIGFIVRLKSGSLNLSPLLATTSLFLPCQSTRVGNEAQRKAQVPRLPAGSTRPVSALVPQQIQQRDDVPNARGTMSGSRRQRGHRKPKTLCDDRGRNRLGRRGL